MRDVHVHFLHGNPIGYSMDFLEGFIQVAQDAGLDEIYLLEHTHQFTEFEKVYEPVKAYNEFQNNWITTRMNGSIEDYVHFIRQVKDNKYPVKVKFGLEVCYIPETADLLAEILKKYDFDFLTGSVHWIDGWGFDHMGQKELWASKNLDEVYKRYYEIMFQLCESSLFDGLAHPDSIKCFGYVSWFHRCFIYFGIYEIQTNDNKIIALKKLHKNANKSYIAEQENRRAQYLAPLQEV